MSNNFTRSDSALSAGEYFLDRIDRSGAQAALIALSEYLSNAPLAEWNACLDDVVRLADSASARAWLLGAISRWPAVAEFRYRLALILWNDNEVDACERVLRDVLAIEPDHAEAVYLFAQLYRSQGKVNAAAVSLHAWCARSMHNQTTLRGALFVSQCQRQDLALELCDREISRNPTNASALALSANLALQLGKFELARERALCALKNKVSLNDWFVMQALAHSQRYSDIDHPDFELFNEFLCDSTLSDMARAATLFARAKALDDVGDYGHAAHNLRDAHELATKFNPWSGVKWAQSIAAEISSQRPVYDSPHANGAVPVFIVGLPRTGTTLISELLGRHHQVRNRGELSFLPFVAQMLSESGRASDPAVLREGAEVYLAQSKQDDTPAHFYVDKNPMNFRHLGLISTLFPNARIIHCKRNRRDTALSIWSQFFAHSDYGFAHTFTNIAAFAEGHDQLMQHWRKTLPMPIHTVDYEALLDRPKSTLDALYCFLGIASTEDAISSLTRRAITSASMWQARQPLYRRSLERWRSYAAFVPELVENFPDHEGI